MPLPDVPAVSIVMPAFNAEPWIGASLASVMAQTWTDWELIVVDDCSVDGTAKLIQDCAARDGRIRYEANPRNLGVAMTRNRGLDLARGRYVAFLDSDDLWMPGKLAAQVAFLDGTGGVVSYCDYLRIDESGAALGRVRVPERLDYRAMLRSNAIGHLTGIYRRQALADLRFDTVGHEDYLFWLRALRRAGTAAATPSHDPLAAYRVGRASLSANKFRAMKWQWDIYRRHLHLPLVRSLWLFPQYVYLALKKRTS